MAQDRPHLADWIAGKLRDAETHWCPQHALRPDILRAPLPSVALLIAGMVLLLVLPDGTPAAMLTRHLAVWLTHHIDLITVNCAGFKHWNWTLVLCLVLLKLQELQTNSKPTENLQLNFFNKR